MHLDNDTNGDLSIDEWANRYEQPFLQKKYLWMKTTITGWCIWYNFQSNESVSANCYLSEALDTLRKEKSWKMGESELFSDRNPQHLDLQCNAGAGHILLLVLRPPLSHHLHTKSPSLTCWPPLSPPQIIMASLPRSSIKVKTTNMLWMRKCLGCLLIPQLLYSFQ